MTRVLQQADSSSDDSILRRALAATGDCVAVLARDGTVTSILHEGACPAEECALLGHRWIDFWRGEDRVAAQQAVNDALLGHSTTIQGYLPDTAMKPAWWQSIVMPLEAASSVTRVLAVTRSVTSERQVRAALKRSADLNGALATATAEIVWHLDVSTGVTKRTGWATFTGQADDPEDLYGWLTHMHPDDRAGAESKAKAAEGDTTIFALEYRLLHHSGSWRWVEDRAVPVLSDEDRVTDWVGIITDIHERKTAHQRLRLSEERLRLAVDTAGLGIWELDCVTGECLWSDEFRRMFGVTADVPSSLETMLDCVLPEDRPIAHRHRQAILSEQMTRNADYRVRSKDTGEVRWINSLARPIIHDHQVIGLIGTVQDVTIRKQAEHRLWLAAHTDALTGIANRSHFQIRLDETIAAARGAASLGVLILDLDRFKEVNDAMGHEAGDRLLSAVADRLIEAVDGSATVARLGGDEFGILVPDTDVVATRAVAGRVLAVLRQPLRYGDREIDCSTSIGWSVYPHHDPQASSLLKNADVALYAAKRAGRGRICEFEAAMQEEVHRHVSVLSSAKTALARDAIVPFYQPKTSFKTGDVIGFEALLRWTDESGVRAPGALQAALDDPELAAKLGTRMLERVTADMRAWADAGVPFGHVALNISAPQLNGGNLVGEVMDRLDAMALKPSQLEIEVTESVLLDAGSTCIQQALRDLHQAGVAVALDDFGTGYASLTHLKAFPVSWLKVDRSFVASVETDAGSAAIVRAVIALAHSIDIKVVAEGIETWPQWDFLDQCRCDLAQGYLIAKPMSSLNVPSFLAHHQVVATRSA